jgi:hypothetical protein
MVTTAFYGNNASAIEGMILPITKEIGATNAGNKGIVSCPVCCKYISKAGRKVKLGKKIRACGFPRSTELQ